jgi:hypothetical protein
MSCKFRSSLPRQLIALPWPRVNENYAYEYDGDFKFV